MALRRVFTNVTRNERGCVALSTRKWPFLCLVICYAYGLLGSYDALAGGASKPPLAERVAEALRGLRVPDPLVVFSISAMPVIELRAGIPAGHALMMPRGQGVSWTDRLRTSANIFLWAVAGNMLPVPFILKLLGPLADFCSKNRLGKRFFDWLFARTRKKSAEVEKYETLGLTIFVAVPLPATGAWTGAMVAFILGMSFAHAMVSIFLGVLIAGVIVSVLCLMGWLGALIAGIALIGVAVSGMLRWLNREEKAMEG